MYSKKRIQSIFKSTGIHSRAWIIVYTTTVAFNIYLVYEMKIMLNILIFYKEEVQIQLYATMVIRYT